MGSMSTDDLKARRAAAQAKIDEYAARALAREREYAEIDAVEKQEREARLAEALASAEEKYGRVGREIEVVRARFSDGTEAGAVIVRRGDPLLWSRFRNTIGDKKGIEIEQTQEALWRPAIVWPPIGEVDALCTTLPHTKTLISDAVARLNGFRMEDLAGK
jgi:hypothetical protein